MASAFRDCFLTDTARAAGGIRSLTFAALTDRGRYRSLTVAARRICGTGRMTGRRTDLLQTGTLTEPGSLSHLTWRIIMDLTEKRVCVTGWGWVLGSHLVDVLGRGAGMCLCLGGRSMISLLSKGRG